jgi:hypothetical protein
MVRAMGVNVCLQRVVDPLHVFVRQGGGQWDTFVQQKGPVGVSLCGRVRDKGLQGRTLREGCTPGLCARVMCAGVGVTFVPAVLLLRNLHAHMHTLSSANGGGMSAADFHRPSVLLLLLL